LHLTFAAAAQLDEARQVKAAVLAMQESNEEAAVQRRRSRRQQQEQQAGAAAGDAKVDSSLQQQQQQPHKAEHQIVADLNQQALAEYKRSIVTQQRQAKAVQQKLQLLRQAWKDAEPPEVLDADAITVVGSFEAALQFSVQYRALLEEMKKQQQQQQQDQSQLGADGSSSSSSSSSKGSVAAPSAVNASMELGAWRRTREAVLQQMKVKELQAVLEAAGWEGPPKKSAKSKKALMQVGGLIIRQ
jgi:hypothetical protein